MTDPGLLERLARHRALAGAPEPERAWLAEHGVLESLSVGDVSIRKDEQAHEMHIVLRGHLVIRVDRGAGSHKIFEWRGGDIGGLLPYSRGATPPNDIVAEEPTEMLVVDRRWFPELTRECPTVTATLVHSMLDRARQFTWGDLRDERLLSLGRLAAGLAHELNNPASAAVRSARLLLESQAEAEAAARQLGAAHLTDAQLQAIDRVYGQCREHRPPEGLSALERSDREEVFATWLRANGTSERCAAPLAETGIELAELADLAAQMRGDALDAALKWIAAGCAIRSVGRAIETSASRVHELVDAVKSFTFLGQAPSAGPVDVGRGLTDTLTVLAAKVRARSADVSIRIADDLPPAFGVGGELNQVWMNLLANALDAIDEGGHVEITAVAERGRILVRVVDDGHGVPPELRERIFEPFFTTKPVGQGSGLGLDIVRRLLSSHDGRIELDSRPGRTEFRVSLPVADETT